MEIVRAELADAEILAELNQHLIEDEQHPNPMNITELTERMREWLATDYICYTVKENGYIIAVYTEMTISTTTCDNCMWIDHIGEKGSLRSCLTGCTKTYGQIRKSDWTYSLIMKMPLRFTSVMASESVSLEWKNKKCEEIKDEIR